MIKVENLDVIFNQNTHLEKHALKGINISLEKGDFVTVIGTNGSGKSTFLSSLAGDISPTNGKIFFDGQDVSRDTSFQRAFKVARIFQDPLIGSCGSLSIEENLALAYKRGERRFLSKALTKETRNFFQEKLARLKLGLENRMHEKMSSLSGGQRQAVSLIMATLAPSSILLLDEHTAALDPAMAHFIMQLTHELIEQNKFTSLMVTHSMQQALSFGNRLIMIYDGEIILDAAKEDRKNLTIDTLLDLFKSKTCYTLETSL